MKKVIIAIICLAVVIGFAFTLSRTTADTQTDTQTTEPTTHTVEEESRSIYLGYFKNKSFNPYKTDSPTNLSISTLLYDSLFVMQDDWSSKPLLAKEISIDEKQIAVKLVDGAVFSNGASLTAYDVVYSFNLAKKCDHFKGRLSNIAGATAGADTVTFTFNKPDVYIQQCLTFPVVQNNTGTASLPVGSGRYVLRSINGEYVLSANPTNTRGEALSTPVIGLTPITAENDEIYRIHTGDLSYYCDTMERGSYTKLNASDVSFTTNNLIYLGYNSANTNLTNTNVIAAIRYAIDKATLADTVFDNFCTLTETPFNPKWFALEGVQLPTYEYNLIKAGNLLDEAGITYAKNDNSYRYDNDGYFDLKLLVNKESPTKVACARFISTCLKNLGVNVTLSSLEFTEYQTALANGGFDLYIGEVKLSPNMDLSSFFRTGGSTSAGIASKTVSSAYSDFKTGSIDINTFIRVFEEEKPFIPLCFRNYIAYYSNEVMYEGTCNENEPFNNIYTWKTEDKTIQ